ncbi:MAG: radical SAM protein [Lachnospiraceae bacterium]|nr:radical SAM protein [Lachnospiraceae bacterium]
MNSYVKNLNRIEFVITFACTGRCKHCSEGEHKEQGEHIDAEAAAKVVRDAADQYKIQSVMTFGGEPLLHPEAVYAIHAAAREKNIPKRQLITNGFFSKDSQRIRAVAQKLAESGVTDILLSVDAFHQETIPLEPVMEFAAAVNQPGIRLQMQPAWLVSETHENPYNRRTREILAKFEAMGIPANSGNVIFPSGNALKYLSEYFESDAAHSNPYEENPNDVRAVSVSPNGDVLGGNIYQTGILELLERYRPGCCEL